MAKKRQLESSLLQCYPFPDLLVMPEATGEDTLGAEGKSRWLTGCGYGEPLFTCSCDSQVVIRELQVYVRSNPPIGLGDDESIAESPP